MSAFLTALVAALNAVPALVSAVTKLVEMGEKIASELAQARAIQEFEAGRKLARETGNTSELERLLGRPVGKL